MNPAAPVTTMRKLVRPLVEDPVPASRPQGQDELGRVRSLAAAVDLAVGAGCVETEGVRAVACHDRADIELDPGAGRRRSGGGEEGAERRRGVPGDARFGPARGGLIGPPADVARIGYEEPQLGAGDRTADATDRELDVAPVVVEIGRGPQPELDRAAVVGRRRGTPDLGVIGRREGRARAWWWRGADGDVV